jgi:hypothetical protein
MTASYHPQRRSRPVETPDLAADLPEPLAVLVEELVGNGAGADSGGVSLDHADDPVDPGRTDPGAGAHPAGDRRWTT